LYLIFLLGGYRAGGKGVCGRLMSPAHETQSMREIRLLRGRLPQFWHCCILEQFWHCCILEQFWQCCILEQFWHCCILEQFWQCCIFCFSLYCKIQQCQNCSKIQQCQGLGPMIYGIQREHANHQCSCIFHLEEVTIWLDRDFNTWYTAFNVSMLTITPTTWLHLESTFVVVSL
jgi:hypothetical protein